MESLVSEIEYVRGLRGCCNLEKEVATERNIQQDVLSYVPFITAEMHEKWQEEVDREDDDLMTCKICDDCGQDEEVVNKDWITCPGCVNCEENDEAAPDGREVHDLQEAIEPRETPDDVDGVFYDARETPMDEIEEYMHSLDEMMSLHFENLKNASGGLRRDSVKESDPRPKKTMNELNMLFSEAFHDICMAEQSDEVREFFEELFEVALDSGAGDHVASKESAPTYKLVESAGSRAGQHFVCAGNKRIPNQGQMTLNLKGPDGAKTIKSTFQVAQVTRPLWSVGRICDEGFKVTFDDQKAEVTDKNGKVVCRFDRHGGLYLSRLRLKNPNFKRSFRRQEPEP